MVDLRDMVQTARNLNISYRTMQSIWCSSSGGFPIRYKKRCYTEVNVPTPAVKQGNTMFRKSAQEVFRLTGEAVGDKPIIITKCGMIPPKTICVGRQIARPIVIIT